MSRFRFKQLAPLTLVASLAGCAGILGIPSDVDRDAPVLDGAETGVPDGPASDTEGGPVSEGGADKDADAEAGLIFPCDLTKPFGGPVPLPGVNTPEDEGSPHFSEDELTLYLDAYRAATAPSYDIYFTNRGVITGPFGPLQTFLSADNSINTSGSDSDGNLTADGKTIFFERQSQATNSDLWTATRESLSDSFGPANKIASLDTPNFDAEIYVRGDGTEVWFSHQGATSTDLALARLVGNAYVIEPATGVLAAVNDPNYFDGYPVISLDRLTLYFASDRPAPSPLGALNIYFATRATTNDAFGTPALVDNVNTPDRDYPGFISGDGCRLYFSSVRVGGMGGQDLYVVTRPQ